jgi:hypothetical protein
MAAYLYEGAISSPVMRAVTNAFSLADVQPEAAPGKNTFVAGFVQGKPNNMNVISIKTNASFHTANVGDTTFVCSMS